MRERLLLFSGGVDSVCAWSLLREPRCLYFAAGHRYEANELRTLAALRELAPGLHVTISHALRVGDMEGADAHIPYRNLLFAALAAAGAGGDLTICLGALRGESSRDKSGRFFRDLSRLLTYTEGRTVRVLAPFRRLTKAQLVRTYLRRGGSPALLRASRSCYNPPADPAYVGCGRCMACFRRWVAMTLNGLVEQYAAHPAGGGYGDRRHWRTYVRRLLRADAREWWGITVNNLDAWRALQLHKRG